MPHNRQSKIGTQVSQQAKKNDYSAQVRRLNNQPRRVVPIMKRYNAEDIDNTKSPWPKMGHCEWCEEEVELVKTRTRRFFGRVIYKCSRCLAIMRT